MTEQSVTIIFCDQCGDHEIFHRRGIAIGTLQRHGWRYRPAGSKWDGERNRRYRERHICKICVGRIPADSTPIKFADEPGKADVLSDDELKTLAEELKVTGWEPDEVSA